MTSMKVLDYTRRELAWSASLVAGVLCRFPGEFMVITAVLWLLPPRPSYLALAGAGGLLCASRVRAHRRPASGWSRVRPLACWWHRAWVRRNWADLATRCGLSVRGRRPDDVEVPRLRRVSSDGPRVVLVVRPCLGQTLETFTGSAERLRMAARAGRIRIEPHGVSQVAITLTLGDVLAESFTRRMPSTSDPVIRAEVPMGLREDGATWLLPVGPHTLIAGSSGAGKGSVFWSFAFGLATGVRAGTVQLHGVDLKGGMEILMGSGLFSSRATDAAEAVGLLERLVEEMQVRTKGYAGVVRSHTASPEQPLHVVMIDELAALTAYCPDRELQRRAEMAVNLLCSQGRAPGFVVFACLQDPRKEVIPARGLFTQMVGLRLKDSTETAMVLGENAVSAGAACHRIARVTPGMGYVVPEEDGFPIRVRAGWVRDEDIRSVAARFESPTYHAVVTAETLLDDRIRRRRVQPREVTGSAVENAPGRVT